MSYDFETGVAQVLVYDILEDVENYRYKLFSYERHQLLT